MLDLSQNVWTLILAADDPVRLSSVSPYTRAAGRVPKQYLQAGSSTLIQQAEKRARYISRPERVVRVVSEVHRRWWEQQLRDISSLSVHVQTVPRGTAGNILLPLFSISARDPEAVVAVMPSHHHVADTEGMARWTRQAASLVASGAAPAITLGLEPSRPAAGYEYLVPGGHDDGATVDIARFIDRPSAPVAQALVRCGALWSSTILCARVRTLIEMFEDSTPELFHTAFRASSRVIGDVAVYESDAMPELDFWLDVVRRRPANVRVMRTPACGWSLEPPADAEEPMAAAPISAA